MRDAQPSAIYLKDYRVPNFLIEKTELVFELAEDGSEVHSKLFIRRNPKSDEPAESLTLHGQQLELLSVAIDGETLSDSLYTVDAESLTIHTAADEFLLECVTKIKPQENTSLEGLYKSKTMFCTQCEAEGFRKITYYLDRPDVMSIFTTTIVADKDRYPILLSNGNNVDSGSLDNGRHWVRWEDPFRKPAYLFALVAGNLEFIEDQFTTQSGSEVTLRIFVEAKDLDKCEHAMTSLINAMRWDEDVYGREYDLNIFNIVAVDDFNMGAMENKSLNIFNTSCVLAKPETTTDAGFQRVEGVVAHEYFHNWSGNRVTCRDWFQLSLKEGFTVFRDAEFSADMGSRTVKRVEDVTLLRTVQFAEDGGPMAHPVRPESFIEISNFYTVTIYEKGAEVVRMIANLLGPEKFRKGSDLYFQRHDGQAATCEDFVAAMEEVSGRDLTQFRRWYSQAGTPRVKVRGEYDSQALSYSLHVEQFCPPTPGQHNKKPFHIPLAVAMVGKSEMLSFDVAGASSLYETVLDVTDEKQTFVFNNVSEEPIPSLLRGFSAPVKLQYNYSRDELTALMSRDNDGFCRWDAAQQLGVLILNEMVSAIQVAKKPAVDERLIKAYESILTDDQLDKAMVALILNLPTEAYMAEINDEVDVQSIHKARQIARIEIARALEAPLWRAYHALSSSQVYQANAEQIAERSLRNTALSYLMLLESEEVKQACVKQFEQSNNMTDTLAAFNCLLASPFDAEKEAALSHFYNQWQDEALVVNQWFMSQAVCTLPGTLSKVKQLMNHAAFDIRNPNKVRALIGAFCGQNAVNFHSLDGEGYKFLADQIISLNKLNPQVASRLLGPLTKWRKYASDNGELMKSQLERIMSEPDLSPDVFEVVSKSM